MLICPGKKRMIEEDSTEPRDVLGQGNRARAVAVEPSPSASFARELIAHKVKGTTIPSLRPTPAAPPSATDKRQPTHVE